VYIYKKERGSAEGYATQDESQTSANGSAHDSAHQRNDKKKTRSSAMNRKAVHNVKHKEQTIKLKLA
jgi:hypothetical protein